MANSIFLTAYEQGGNPVLSSPLYRYVASDQVQWFQQDSGVTGANTRINLFFGVGNGYLTTEWQVAQTVTAISQQLTNFIPLTVYQTGDQSQPVTNAVTPIARYYNPVTFQAFFADASTGVSGVSSQVDFQFRKGNGHTSGITLVGETIATIQSKLG